MYIHYKQYFVYNVSVCIYNLPTYKIFRTCSQSSIIIVVENLSIFTATILIYLTLYVREFNEIFILLHCPVAHTIWPASKNHSHLKISHASTLLILQLGN